MAGCMRPSKTHLGKATFCSFCLNTLRVTLTDDLCVRRTWKITPEKELRCNAAFAILYCAEAVVPEGIVRLYAVVTVTDLVIRPRGRQLAWVRELWPRSIEASICLLDCRLAKMGNPGRRKGSAAPTSEALVRRKGRFSKRGYAGRVQALKAAPQRKHDQDEQQRRSEDAVDAHQGEQRPSMWEQRRRGRVSVL